MTRPRAILLALALLGLAGGIAVLLLRTGDPAARSGAGVNAPEASERSPAPEAVLAAPAAGEPEATAPPIRLPPPETSTTPKIRGVVVDAEGRPIPQVEVRIHTEWILSAEHSTLQGGGRTGTDSEGRFSLEALPEITRWLEVDGRPMHTMVVMRVAAGEREVRSVLERRRVVTVTVLDTEGRPVTGALTTVAPARDETSVRAIPILQRRGTDWTEVLVRRGLSADEGTTDRTGVVRIRVGPGRHVAGATPPLHVVALPTHGIPVEGDSVVVHLDPAFELSGTALDVEGKPLPQAYVAWRLRGGPWSSKHVDFDGAFHLGRVPKGIVEIRAQLDPAPPDPDGPGIETPTGRRDLALTVDPGADLRVDVEGLAPGTRGLVALLARPPTVPRSNNRQASIAPGEEATFLRLRRDVGYLLQAVSSDGKRTGTWSGPLPPDGRVRIRLVEAGSLRVLLEAPGSVAVTAVDVDGVPATYTYANPPHEELVLSLVPHGPARVTVSARTLKDPVTFLRGSADTQVPGTARVRLDPVPEERRARAEFEKLLEENR